MAIKFYKKKLKKIEEMAPSVTDMIIKSLDEIKLSQKDMYHRINSLEIGIAKMKIKIGIWGSLVGAGTSALVVIGAILLRLI